MELTTLLLFSMTVLPLICTPGPDILFTVSQGLFSGPRGALQAVAGILLGYMGHAILSAVGVAALIATYPHLFDFLRWLGVAYLTILALKMLRSALTRGAGIVSQSSKPVSLWRGFLTSFLNPKGLLMYFAVLPQFIDPADNVVLQAIVLSGLFILGCGIVYGIIGLVSARVSARVVSDNTRRRIEGIAGTLLIIAATRVAIQ